MAIRERLEADQREAMRQGQSLRLGTIRMLRTAIQNAEQARRKELTDKLIEQKRQALPAAGTATEGEIAISDEEVATILRDAALSDQQVMDNVLAREVKQRRDAAEQFRKANRQDLLDREEAELQVLLAYLPEQLSEVEIEALAAATIAEVGASTPREMGKVMGRLTPQLRGKADMGAVSKIVQRLLSA